MQLNKVNFTKNIKYRNYSKISRFFLQLIVLHIQGRLGHNAPVRGCSAVFFIDCLAWAASDGSYSSVPHTLKLNSLWRTLEVKTNQIRKFLKRVEEEGQHDDDCDNYKTLCGSCSSGVLLSAIKNYYVLLLLLFVRTDSPKIALRKGIHIFPGCSNIARVSFSFDGIKVNDCIYYSFCKRKLSPFFPFIWVYTHSITLSPLLLFISPSNSQFLA